MRICFLFLSFFISVCFSSQIQEDKTLLLQKGYEALVANPKRSEETALYILHNVPDQRSQQEAKLILIKSLYYQNDISRMLEQINTDSSDSDPESLITVSSIIYSLGINKGYYFENTSKNKFTHSFIKLYSSLDKKDKKNSMLLLKDLISKTTIKNRFALREFWIKAFEEIDKDQFRTFRQEVRKLMAIYKDDDEFRLMNILFSLKERAIVEARINLEKIESDSLEYSPNKYLKRRYYETLSQLYFDENNKVEYIKTKEKRNEINKEIEAEITKGRSLWFASVQRQNKEHTENVIQKSKSILWGIGASFIILVITLTIRLSQLKSRQKQFRLFQKKIESFSVKKNSQNIISEKTENLLLTRLNKFELTKEYLKPDISLQSLAKKLDTNTKYLSETINTHKQKNFNLYINELRVNYVLLKLKDEKIYRNYKIKYLADESGFSSHSLFASIFKSVTGMSPMLYIKFLNENEDDNEDGF